MGDNDGSRQHVSGVWKGGHGLGGSHCKGEKGTVTSTNKKVGCGTGPHWALRHRKGGEEAGRMWGKFQNTQLGSEN